MKDFIDFIDFIDFTNMSDEEKFKLLNKKDYEIDRYKNIIDELENFCWELKAMGCREGALDMLDKLKELKERNKIDE